MKSAKKFLGGAAGLITMGFGAASCISPTSPIAQSTQGCPELQEGATIDANVQVDARVRALMQGSLDLDTIRKDLKVTVHDSCSHIASDLGADDTWTALGDSDDAISNDKGTGACDAAAGKIKAIMESDVAAKAHFSLILSPGECHIDFTAEASCEQGCSAQTKCDPGKVEERCEAGQLSVKCADKCTATSFCEGRVDVQANCAGSCDAECSGECQGTCIADDGTTADNTTTCKGKCTGTCKGTCTGSCQVSESAGISCGANVSCRGSCTSTFSDPVCESVVTPPKCTIDEACFDGCRTTAAMNQVCNPPQVRLIADVSVSADVQKLVTTINANLPPLVVKAQAEGKIAVKVGEDLNAAGTAVLNASGDLDGKSLGCATAAAKSISASAQSLHVAANSGTKVAGTCSSHAK